MHYGRAPITEALIDIKVELSSEVDVTLLKNLANELSADYPREETRTMASAHFVFSSEVRAETEQKELGFARFSKDGKHVVQFRLDGFTFSRLEPYDTWEHLQHQAKALWSRYRDATKPKKITRIAVRYINQFNFPGPSIDLEEYLNIFPEISKRLPAPLRDMGPFAMAIQMPQPDLEGTLIINEAIVNPKAENTIAIILDLDLFVVNPNVPNDDALWALFERLRTRKNEYFEAFITPKTRRLIN